MLIVGSDASRVDVELVAGRIECPACGGGLRPWGWARLRRVRRVAGEQEVRPRRGRCGACERTHVLLPEGCLLRRRDAVEVIGAALVAKAQGVGHRRIAERLGVPADTVRGWLRRFAVLAERVRAHFWRWAHALDASLPVFEPTGTLLGDAVSALGAATRAAVLRLGLRPVWAWASAMSGGRLLSNTDCPWPAP